MAWRKRLAAGIVAAGVALGGGVALSAPGDVLFHPDYAPSLASQGWHVQAPTDHPEALQLLDAPAGGPSRALRAELRPGWRNPVGDTARAEVYALHGQFSSTPEPEWPLHAGGAYEFTLSYYLQSPWATATDSTWLVLSQWKGDKGGSPKMAVEIKRTSLDFVVDGKRFTTGGRPINQWTTLTVRFGLGPYLSNGWVEVSRDGVLKVPRFAVHTQDLYNGLPDKTYFKQGIYRSDGWDNITADPMVAWFAAPVVTEIDAAP